MDDVVIHTIIGITKLSLKIGNKKADKKNIIAIKLNVLDIKRTRSLFIIAAVRRLVDVGNWII